MTYYPKQLSVFVPPELQAPVHVLAKREFCPVSQIVRRAIVNEIERCGLTPMPVDVPKPAAMAKAKR
jgi:predicted DNA-binding protein